MKGSGTVEIALDEGCTGRAPRGGSGRSSGGTGQVEEAECVGGTLHALPEGSNNAVALTSVPNHEGCSFHLPLLSPVAWVATLTSGLKCQESTMRL